MKGHPSRRPFVYPVEVSEKLEFPLLGEPYIEFGPPGLVALGGDLSIPRMLLAYRSGIFPWSVNPISWWSPHQRGIIEFSKFHVGQTLRRVIRQQPFELTANRAFRQVMEACATTRQLGNWISPEMIDAYSALHEAGHAHSVECWLEGKLVGGIYGVAIGGMFAAESMFYRKSNASKIALVKLIETLRQSGFSLIDVQMVTPTTEAFGAVEIARREYLSRLKKAVSLPVKFCFATETK